MLGPPGAGKGTQAERFARSRACRRSRRATSCARRSAGTDVGLARQGDHGRGELVSDDVMIGDRRGSGLSARRRARGFVLDGFPRTVAQAEALDAMMTGRGPLVVVDIVVPEDVLVRRLAARPICGELRHRTRWSTRTSDATTCAKCGGALVQRADDNDGGRARAAEGVSAADQAARRLLPGAADVPVDGRRPAAGSAWRRDRCGDRGGCGAAGDGAAAVIVCRSPAELEKMRAAEPAGRARC